MKVLFYSNTHEPFTNGDVYDVNDKAEIVALIASSGQIVYFDKRRIRVNKNDGSIQIFYVFLNAGNHPLSTISDEEIADTIKKFTVKPYEEWVPIGAVRPDGTRDFARVL